MKYLEFALVTVVVEALFEVLIGPDRHDGRLVFLAGAVLLTDGPPDVCEVLYSFVAFVVRLVRKVDVVAPHTVHDRLDGGQDVVVDDGLGS